MLHYVACRMVGDRSFPVEDEWALSYISSFKPPPFFGEMAKYLLKLIFSKNEHKNLL